MAERRTVRTRKGAAQSEEETAAVTTSRREEEFVSALARGLKILQVFDAEHTELTLTEVGVLSGLSTATARRLLFTLRALGFVTNYGRKFLLTPQVLRLAAGFAASMRIGEVAQQHLQEMVDATGDSSSMAVLDGADVIYLASAQTRRPLQFSASPGTRYAAYPTALGRVLLAALPAEAVDRLLGTGPLTALTELTVTDPKAFREILQGVRLQGYASVQDELDYGTVSVAVPVRDRRGATLAALNCSSSPSRIQREDMVRTRLPLLRQAAERISAALQHTPTLIHAIRPAG